MKITKSPSAPSRSLPDCFNEGMKLYEIFPNAQFDQTQIANVLGLSVTSSSLKGWISDLKHYGLIEKTGADEYVVSEAVKESSIADQKEQNAIRYELAMRPKLFSQIIKNQGNHLPDNSVLANVLTARFGFNKARALKVAKALRSSLDWAGALDAKGNILRPRTALPDDAGSIATQALDTNQSAAHLTDQVASVTSPPIEASLPKEELLRSTELPLVTDIPLGDGRVIHIEYPPDITDKDADRACLVLKALCGRR